MANTIIIAGDTGTGKSSSIATLNPKETFVINVLNKPLPFKDSRKMYSGESRNITAVKNYSDILNILEVINNDKNSPIKNIIIDDVGFTMMNELFARVMEGGYSKFTSIAQHMQQIIDRAKTLRDDLNIIMMFHDEKSEGEVEPERKLKLAGRMIEKDYNPMATVTIVLFTAPEFIKTENNQLRANYRFVTNRSVINGILYPAKSPQGMFDTLFVPNDLQFVLDKVKEYYG